MLVLCSLRLCLYNVLRALRCRDTKLRHHCQRHTRGAQRRETGRSLSEVFFFFCLVLLKLNGTRGFKRAVVLCQLCSTAAAAATGKKKKEKGKKERKAGQPFVLLHFTVSFFYWVRVIFSALSLCSCEGQKSHECSEGEKNFPHWCDSFHGHFWFVLENHYICPW